MNDSAYMVWILDVSGSMEMSHEKYGKRIDGLRACVKKYQDDTRYAHLTVHLLTFATDVFEIDSSDRIPDPHGNTNLHIALDRAAELMAGHVLIFTDGEPSEKEACFEAAAKIPGMVDAVFIGDDNDREAIRFCEKLSRNNGGRTVIRDILKGQSLICGEVRDLLGLPAPIVSHHSDFTKGGD